MAVIIIIIIDFLVYFGAQQTHQTWGIYCLRKHQAVQTIENDNVASASSSAPSQHAAHSAVHAHHAASTTAWARGFQSEPRVT